VFAVVTSAMKFALQNPSYDIPSVNITIWKESSWSFKWLKMTILCHQLVGPFTLCKDGCSNNYYKFVVLVA